MPDYMGDSYTTDCAWYGDKLSSIKKNVDKNIAALEKADLITINLGNNNLIGTLAFALEEIFEEGTRGTRLEQAANAYIEKAKEAVSEYEALVTLLDGIETLNKGACLLTLGSADLINALGNFRSDWDTLLGEVRRLSPESEIVVLGIYNSTGSVAQFNLEGLSDFTASILNKLTDPVIDFMNYIMSTASKYADEYTYIDVSDIADFTNSRDGSHLGRVGHANYAQKIEEVLKAGCTCDHANARLVNVRAASKLLPGYSGDLVCPDCGKTLEKGSMTVFTCSHENLKVLGAFDATRLTFGFTGTCVCADCGAIVRAGRLIMPVR